jgi:prophage antirepressor-like protein
MNIAPATYYFERQAVRTLTRDGDPWFIAADLCAVLGIGNPRDAIERLDPDEKGVALTDTPGGEQEMNIISESGAYTLILRCRDAVKAGTPAHRFRKWLTTEVIPTIRKTGGYGQASPEMLGLLRELIQMQSQTLRVIEGLGKKRGGTTRPPTQADIPIILDSKAEGLSGRAIAQSLNLSEAAVSLIYRGLYHVRPDGTLAMGLRPQP